MPPAHETVAEIVAFLARHPPFAELDRDALAAIAGRMEIEYFPRGDVILGEGGAPAQHLYVVRRGAVELLAGGDLVEVLEEGEPFGHPSLLSGLPPAFTVRAREDTLCYLLGRADAERVLAGAGGTRFLAVSLAERLLRRRASGRSRERLAAIEIGALVQPPLICPATMPIRDVARYMTEADDPSALVRLEDGYGTVSDRDLREHVASGRVPVDAPVSQVAAPVVSVAPDTLALDALVELLEAGTGLVAVVDGDRLLGIVSYEALLDVQAPSPLVLRRRIDRAQGPEELAALASELPQLAVRLLDASVEALDVLGVLATTGDAITRRLLELTVADLGEPPTPWAWLVLGSQARREQTLATDQDNALAFDGEGEEVERYFAELAERVNAGLAACGYAECRAGVMARNPAWRLPREQWLELFERWFSTPSVHDTHIAMIALDLRAVAGTLPIQAALEQLLETAPRRPFLLERLTAAAVETRPPTGFLRDFIVDRHGEHAGTLDIKAGGTVPLVRLARLHALSVGSTAISTVRRLREAAAGGTLDGETAAELEEAFVALSAARLEHQAAQVQRGEAPDNHLDPRELPPLARRQLKEAFRAVARAQDALPARPATRVPRVR